MLKISNKGNEATGILIALLMAIVVPILSIVQYIQKQEILYNAISDAALGVLMGIIILVLSLSTGIDMTFDKEVTIKMRHKYKVRIKSLVLLKTLKGYIFIMKFSEPVEIKEWRIFLWAFRFKNKFKALSEVFDDSDLVTPEIFLIKDEVKEIENFCKKNNIQFHVGELDTLSQIFR